MAAVAQPELSRTHVETVKATSKLARGVRREGLVSSELTLGDL